MRACFHACFHGGRWSAIEELIQGIYRFIKKCKRDLPAVPALSAAVSCMPHAFSENPGKARLYARPACGRKERDEGVKNDRLDPGGSSAREKTVLSRRQNPEGGNAHQKPVHVLALNRAAEPLAFIKKQERTYGVKNTVSRTFH